MARNKSTRFLYGSYLSFQGAPRKSLQQEISMMDISRIPRFLATLGITIISLLLSSCTSSIPASKAIAPSIKKSSSTVIIAKQFVPEGWADITSKSIRPEIKYWLIHHDNSATMVLRQFYIDSTTQKSMVKDDVNIVTNISLLSKLPENNSDYRVTRVPEVIDVRRNFFSYVYSEKGLLRRVIVFKKQQKYFELELIQERSSAEFEILTGDLLTFATTLYER